MAGDVTNRAELFPPRLSAREVLVEQMTTAWRAAAHKGEGNTPSKVITICAEVALDYRADRSDRLRLVMAEALAAGGPLEDEMDAVDEVLDAMDAAGYEVMRRE